MSALMCEDIDSRVMTVIRDCASVHTAADFSEFMQGSFCDVFPHEISLCGIHGIGEQGNHIHKMVNHNYPREYFEAILSTLGKFETPLTKKWRITRVPEGFQSGRDDDLFPSDWVNVFKKYDMRNTIGHGVTDIAGTLGSFFLFYRMPGQIGPEHASFLKIITPHLHQAILRAAPTINGYQEKAGRPHKAINDHQRIILYWLHEGKTNWEIAKILNVSERNVKYHLKQIFLALEVHSRAHAVAKAGELGLFVAAGA